MHKHILVFNHLTWPVNWTKIFGRDSPLIIEIGFGNAQFLVTLAECHLDCNFLGLEISFPAIRAGQEKLNKFELDNVRLIKATAQKVLWALCPPGSVQALFINFPDPWPKAAHHRRRLINEQFLHLAATRLLPGSEIYIATDHTEYAEWITKCLIDSKYFDNRATIPFVTNNDQFEPTKYEKKAINEGRSCHYFRWQRNCVSASEVFPIPEEVAMPHVLLQMPVELDEISRRFTSSKHTIGSVNVHLIDLFQSSSNDTLVIDTYIREDPIEQRIFFVIKRRRNGQVLLQLHDAGHPRSTIGTHYALQCLANVLCDNHQEAMILRHNLKGEI